MTTTGNAFASRAGARGAGNGRSPSEPAVLTEGLERSFGEVRAVRGVDLAVQPGEIYGFLGPNGAGKSTVVKMLCTLLAPTGGRARVAGFDVADQAEAVRLRIGAALQEAALDDKQTGRELLRLQARLYGLRRAEVDRRVEEITSFMDLGDALDRRLGTYSGGMKRRLDLAAALVHNPEVLFLDEPTTGLDPISRARVWEEVRRLNTEAGTTIFLTTQYLEEADALAGRVGIISEGLLVAEGSPDELKRRLGSGVIVAAVDGGAERARAALVGVEGVESAVASGDELTVRAPDAGAAVTPVAVALAGAGVRVRSLEVRTPTLDDVFLELTGNRIQQDENEEEAA